MAEDRNFQANYIEGVNKFQGLRSRAFLEEMMKLLRGKSTELLSFEDVRARLRLREESYRGLQDIPLEQIVGSVGRHAEFTTSFLPRTNEMRERWSRVYAQMNSMSGVPPIEVYKVGDTYFIRDGNHRVSVARNLGSKTIQAHVWELPTSVEMKPGMTVEDLDAAAAYVNFLDETGLRTQRPHHQSLQVTNPVGYAEMLAHIYLHGQIMEQRVGHPVKMAEAAADWYDRIYRPAVTLIRKYEVLEIARERKLTEADLYIWMADHLREIRRQYGDVNERRTFSHAIIDFLAEKKIAIPSDLLEEDDETVLLSRTQVMREVEEERRFRENGDHNE